MGEQVTTEKIREVALEARSDRDSYLNCNPINPKIGEALKQAGLSIQQVKGTFSTRRSHVGGEEHLYLTVRGKDVAGTAEPVIVDGAIDQFCIENYEQGRVFEQIGPRETIPTVAVLTRGDEWYDCYYKEQNF